MNHEHAQKLEKIKKIGHVMLFISIIIGLIFLFSTNQEISTYQWLLWTASTIGGSGILILFITDPELEIRSHTLFPISIILLLIVSISSFLYYFFTLENDITNMRARDPFHQISLYIGICTTGLTILLITISKLRERLNN